MQAEDVPLLQNIIAYYPFRGSLNNMIPNMEFAICGMNQVAEKVKSLAIKPSGYSTYFVRQGKAHNKTSMAKQLGKGKTLIVANSNVEERLTKDNYKNLHKDYRLPIEVVSDSDYLEIINSGEDFDKKLIVIPLGLGGLLFQVYDLKSKKLIYSGNFNELAGIYGSDTRKFGAGNFAPFSDWMLDQQ